MVMTIDVGYGTRRRTTILTDAYVTRSVHDSTPSLGGELLRSIDVVIRDVDVEDDDEQRQDEIEDASEV